MSVVYDKQNDMLVYDRKLRDGSGSNMYGLEVCKSLQLPDEFIKAAFEIRTKYNPENSSLLNQRSSHFNSRKIVSMCEKCLTKPAIEVHHLQHQHNANEDGLIYNSDGVFYKNNLANLMSLCEKCHNEIHKNFKNGSKRVKTTKGYKIQEIKI
jgi:DNA mismatch repair protein MutS